jgi:hypothetical protein
VKLLRKVVLKKARPYEYEVDVDGVTQGNLTTYLECRERARLAIIEGWTSGGVSMPLVLGSIGHEFLDWWHHSKTDKGMEEAIQSGYQKVVGEIPVKQLTTAVKDMLEEDFAILKRLLMAYAKNYQKIDRKVEWVGSEDEFMFRVDGTPVRGKIDGAFRSGTSNPVRLLESKFKARWSEEAMTDWLPLDLQTGMYITAMKYDEKLRDKLKLRKGEFPKSFRYDVIRKPQLRKRKDESIKDFASRVEEDLRVRPEHYFNRWDVELTKQDLERQEAKIFKLVREFRTWAYTHQEARRQKRAKPETIWTSAACEGKYSICPFLPVCAREDYNSLRMRERPHAELADIRLKG